MSTEKEDGLCENKLCSDLDAQCSISSNSTQGIGLSINNNNADAISVCANCGEEGDDVNNICNKCNLVKYCNAVCKKKHRHKHKKQCEEYIRLFAERAAKLHDEKLFNQPPSTKEDCPICFLRMPSFHTGRQYMSCCGKTICSGCVHAPVYDDQGNKVNNRKCPFCRTPHPRTDEEVMERLNKRVALKDPMAIHKLGVLHSNGTLGLPQNNTKALELFHQASELGCAGAYVSIGVAYEHGEGVEVDKKTAKHYWEVAAIGGNDIARYNLGVYEKRDSGGMKRALKHWMISVRSGHSNSLKRIKELYTNGDATKDDYIKALRLYQEYLDEIKSVQRDKAAAAHEKYRYY